MSHKNLRASSQGLFGLMVGSTLSITCGGTKSNTCTDYIKGVEKITSFDIILMMKNPT